jgi:hypothetical protein
MPDGKTPAQIRKLLKGSGGSFEKIKHKPKKYNPDKRNTNKARREMRDA